MEQVKSRVSQANNAMNLSLTTADSKIFGSNVNFCSFEQTRSGMCTCQRFSASSMAERGEGRIGISSMLLYSDNSPTKQITRRRKRYLESTERRHTHTTMMWRMIANWQHPLTVRHSIKSKLSLKNQTNQYYKIFFSFLSIIALSSLPIFQRFPQYHKKQMYIHTFYTVP